LAAYGMNVGNYRKHGRTFPGRRVNAGPDRDL